MEVGREIGRRGPVAQSATRWFVRAQGQTLGPYSTEGILAALQTGELLPTDRVITDKEHAWTRLEEHPFFASFRELVDRPRAEELHTLPSPHKLRIKTPVPVQARTIPVPVSVPVAAPAPVAPLAEAPEPVVTSTAEVAPAPIPEPLPTSAAEVPPPQATEKVEVKAEPKPEKKSRRKKSRPEAKAELTPAPAPEPAHAAEPELDKDYADLLAAALALERALDALPSEPEPLLEPGPAPSAPLAETTTAPPGLTGFPERPEIKPVFLPEPEPKKLTPRSRDRVIRFELKLPERPLRALLALALVAALAAWSGSHLVGHGKGLWSNKTRGQNGFRPSDPSSPTTSPSEAGDPNPPLKAPTRPQRD